MAFVGRRQSRLLLLICMSTGLLVAGSGSNTDSHPAQKPAAVTSNAPSIDVSPQSSPTPSTSITSSATQSPTEDSSSDDPSFDDFLPTASASTPTPRQPTCDYSHRFSDDCGPVAPAQDNCTSLASDIRSAQQHLDTSKEILDSMTPGTSIYANQAQIVANAQAFLNSLERRRAEEC